MQKNANARPAAQARKPFKTAKRTTMIGVHLPNGSLYGRACGNKGYAVFSYGEHWPLFVHDGAQWFENSEKCGPTTSQHRMQSHPTMYTNETTTLRTCDELIAMVCALDDEDYEPVLSRGERLYQNQLEDAAQDTADFDARR